MRGRAIAQGTTRTAKNGYHYTRTETKWRLTHHLVAEEMLGRPLRANERVKFGSKGKECLDPENIIIERKGTSMQRKRIAIIEDRIRELEAEKAEILSQLGPGCYEVHK